MNEVWKNANDSIRHSEGRYDASQVQFRRGDRIEYAYDAAGVKRQEVHKVANRDLNYLYWSTNVPAASDFDASKTVTTDYIGNKVYVNNQLKYVLTEEGYIEKTGAAYSAHYYLNDHLGSHRIVMDANGTVEQVNNYYPSGTSMAERRTDQGVQPYKFGGKELDRTNNMDFYDFDARSYDPTLMRFTRPDPMAEKYYSMSPYMYCGNNPVKYIDPTGDEIWIYYDDEKGKQQQMLYTANMKYEGNNTFVSTSVNYLNSVYSNGGAKVMDELISSTNNFNMINKIPTDENGNSLNALQFSESKWGGGDIYAGVLTDSKYSDYLKVEGVSHELFHGFQYEQGQGGASVFNEVEAMVYSAAISDNWANSTGYSGALSSNGLGNGTENGNVYQQSFKNLVQNGFSKDVFHTAVKTFQSGSSVNMYGKYNNYPLVLTPKSYLLRQYHPNHPIK